MALEITSENIQKIISDNQIVIIDLWRDSCPPCRVIGPIIDQLAQENTDIIIGKLDTSKYPDITSGFGVTSVPTLIYFKDGKEVERTKGVLAKSQLEVKIALLKAPQ